MQAKSWDQVAQIQADVGQLQADVARSEAMWCES
jgi:hypothetical protein